MPAVLRCPTCPICHAWIAPQAIACPACHAQRQPRRGMSLQAFQVYATIWLLCSALVLLVALRIAVTPWLPAGEPPGYALWMLRATETKPPPACRITVRDQSGQEVLIAMTDDCNGAGPAAQPNPAAARHVPEHAALLRVLASGLHSLLALLLGGLACWGLRNALRRSFRRPAGFAWVSHNQA
jgi:hypothetical protein